MTADIQQISLGMEVRGRDGEPWGTVGRIFYPDGRVDPPDPGAQGLFNLETGGRTVDPQAGFFQCDRPFQPDWFVSLTDVTTVADTYLTVDATTEEGEKRAWREKPVNAPGVQFGVEA